MSNESQEKDWRWGLQFLRDQGWTFVKIGGTLNASEKSVRRWFSGIRKDRATGRRQATTPLPMYARALADLAKREERKAQDAPPLLTAVPA